MVDVDTLEQIISDFEGNVHSTEFAKELKKHIEKNISARAPQVNTNGTNNRWDMKKYEGLWNGPKTVGDFIELLSTFPADWPVLVSTQAGGGIAVEHRDSKNDGKPFVGIFGKNGGRFGEDPLTEEKYQEESDRFISDLEHGKLYTSIHGDHRTYSPRLGSQATCYGSHYDRRIIERMVREGKIPATSVDIERVAKCES